MRNRFAPIAYWPQKWFSIYEGFRDVRERLQKSGGWDIMSGQLLRKMIEYGKESGVQECHPWRDDGSVVRDHSWDRAFYFRSFKERDPIKFDAYAISPQRTWYFCTMIQMEYFWHWFGEGQQCLLCHAPAGYYSGYIAAFSCEECGGILSKGSRCSDENKRTVEARRIEAVSAVFIEKSGVGGWRLDDCIERQWTPGGKRSGLQKQITRICQ